MRRLMQLGLAIVIFTMGRSARANEGLAEPTVVLRLKAFDGLMADVKYLAELAGQADKAKEIDGVIQSLAGPKGLGGTGLDTSRPFLAYGIVGPNGVDSKLVVMLPIADESAFLETVNGLAGPFGVSVKKDSDGVHAVTIPNAPVGVFVRFANRYAYVGVPDRSAVEPSNLLLPAGNWISAEGSEVVGLKVNIDRIPNMVKQIALGQLDLQIANAKEQAGPNETPIQAKLKKQVVDTVFGRIKAVMTEGKAIEIRLGIDRSASDITFRTSFTAKAGSGLARSIANTHEAKTVFAGVTADAAKLAVSLTLPEELRASFAAVVDEGIAETLKKEKEPGKKEAARKLLEVLAPTLKAGILNLTAGLRGPNSAGHYTAFAGAQLQGGKAVEKVLKDLSTHIPERDRGALTLDAALSGSTAIHKIDPGKDIGPDGRRLFGDRAAGYVAFRPDAAFLVIGDATALDEIKSLVASRPGTVASLIDVQASVAKLATLDPKNGAAAQRAAAQAFGGDAAGKDVIGLKLTGGDALTIRVNVKAEIVRFGSLMHDKKGD